VYHTPQKKADTRVDDRHVRRPVTEDIAKVRMVELGLSRLTSSIPPHNNDIICGKVIDSPVTSSLIIVDKIGHHVTLVRVARLTSGVNILVTCCRKNLCTAPLN
jgi:hypothetical protein